MKEGFYKKIIGAIAGFMAGIAVFFLCENTGLGKQGMICLAILSWAIIWWIAGVLPEFATGILMVVGFVVLGGVEFSVALTPFSSGTWWLLVAAFGIGAGMRSSGLMRRIALAVVSKFPSAFPAQVGGLMAVGTVLGPLVPSLAAKASILTPIARGIGEAMGFKDKDRQMQGLFLATMCGVRNIAPAVVSASIIGYALWGLYPQEVQVQFDMVHWFAAALPWFAVVTVLNYLTIVLLYRPKKGNCTNVVYCSGIKNSGPMSFHEKEMLAIVLITVAMWLLQPIHGVPSYVVALLALVAMVACGIMTKSNLKSDIAWDSLIFIGIAIGLANVFDAVGIQEWLVAAVGPIFQQLSDNSYLFLMGICFATILMRFVIVSEVAYVNIVMAFLIPLAIAQGINPWVVGFAVYVTLSPWFALYQNAIYLAAFYSVDGEMVRHGDMAKYCFVYMGISIAALMASVPFWQGMGLMG